MSIDFLKDYDNCVSYCDYDLDNLEGCIQSIKDEKNDQSLCAVIVKNNNCDIVNTDNFRNLISFLIKFLRFLYCVRSHHNENKYDEQIMRSISKIKLSNFNLSLDDLTCVGFPGDKTLVHQFPRNLAEYFIIMKKISKVEQSGHTLERSIKTDEVLSKYEGFCSDYQPWSRTLSTFLNIHSERLFGTSIPKIGDTSKYGDFITNCAQSNARFERLLKNTSTLETKLIKYLKTETNDSSTVSKRKRSSKKSSDRRSSKGSAKKKSHRLTLGGGGKSLKNKKKKHL